MILASKSPRRKEILENIGIEVVVAVPDIEEGAVDWKGVQPRDTGGVTQGIAIPGYKSITIDADRTDVKVNFNNPEGNPCYFVISLVLDDGTVAFIDFGLMKTISRESAEDELAGLRARGGLAGEADRP